LGVLINRQPNVDLDALPNVRYSGLSQSDEQADLKHRHPQLRMASKVATCLKTARFYASIFATAHLSALPRISFVL
jgi:hypothetical protein